MNGSIGWLDRRGWMRAAAWQHALIRRLRSGARTRPLLFLLVPCALLAACGAPVPPERAAYVGEWRHPTMRLLIAQDGTVRYQRIEDGVTTSINAPLKGFIGDDFEVGLGPASTVFEVAEAPHREGGRWTMVVDGVELERVDAGGGDSGGTW